jgi:hypothetical protein
MVVAQEREACAKMIEDAPNNIRNATLEEVAQEFEKMKVFEADTMASIAIHIREMKR